MGTTKNDPRLAVIIDADNVPCSSITGMMEEIAKYGTPTFKRIYGDWTKPHLSGWKKVLLENAITPIQQYNYTTGKNATDSAMIIDAMDILYSNKVEGFCIVSSDSDFTRLAVRLRESGMLVLGFGECKTPEPFIVACDKFVYLEILSRHREDKPQEEEPAPADDSSPCRTLKAIGAATVRILAATVADVADDDGWAYLGDVGNLLIKKMPDFDPRNYGYDKLTPLIKSLKNNFEIDERNTERNNIKHVYIRVKSTAPRN